MAGEEQNSVLELYSILRSPSSGHPVYSTLGGQQRREVRPPGTASPKMRLEAAGLDKLHFVVGRCCLFGGALITAVCDICALIGVLLYSSALGVTGARMIIFFGETFWRTRHLFFRTGRLAESQAAVAAVPPGHGAVHTLLELLLQIIIHFTILVS